MKVRILILALFAVLLAGCVQTSQRAPSTRSPKAVKVRELTELTGTRWTLSVLDGQAIVPSATGWAAPGIDFADDGQSASGFSGVNRFGGRYIQDGAALTFGPLAMTRRAGPPDLMETERRFTRVLSGATGWRQRGADIELIAAKQVGAVLTPVAAKK
jgi:heat shock protein HslJ